MEKQIILKDCDCDDWRLDMNQINSFILFAFSHGITYKGKQFRYCPWCGKEREINNEENI